MAWEDRLRDLAIAGGLMAAMGCSSTSNGTDTVDGGDAAETGGIPCGNANPDPCICGRPDTDPVSAAQCTAEKACVAKGGTYRSGTCDGLDSGPADAGSDATDATDATDASGDGTTHD